MTDNKAEDKIEEKEQVEKTETKVENNTETKEENKSENKTRKRKWDDQGPASDGVITPPNPAILNSANSGNDSKAKDPNAIAQVAAQAAKISAMLQAKGIPIHTSSPSIPVIPNTTTTSTESPTTPSSDKPKEKVVKGEFFKDIEINDLKNKYVLIKAQTIAKLEEETKAGIITRGKYYPNKALATEKDPPLYLHVAAATQEILDNAVAKIQEIIDSKPVTLVAQPEINNNANVYHKPTINNRYHQAKIFIGIDDRSFNTKLKLIGIQGKNVKHIHYATGAKIQLKGKGSGFIEPTSGQEAFEPMFFQISSKTEEGLESAKKLVDDLINTVKGEYEKFKQYRASRPNIPPRPPYNSYNQTASYAPYSATPLPPGLYSAGQNYSQYNGYSSYAPPPPPIAGADTAQPPPPSAPYPQMTTPSTTAPPVPAGQAPPPPPPAPMSYYQQPSVAAAPNQYPYYGAASYNPYYYYPPPLPTTTPPPPAANPPGSTTTSSESTPYQPGNPTSK